jgi:hypothetical protein
MGHETAAHTTAAGGIGDKFWVERRLWRLGNLFHPSFICRNFSKKQRPKQGVFTLRFSKNTGFVKFIYLNESRFIIGNHSDSRRSNGYPHLGFRAIDDPHIWGFCYF